MQTHDEPLANFINEILRDEVALKSRRESSLSYLEEHIINVPFQEYFAYFRNSVLKGSLARISHTTTFLSTPRLMHHSRFFAGMKL